MCWGRRIAARRRATSCLVRSSSAHILAANACLRRANESMGLCHLVFVQVAPLRGQHWRAARAANVPDPASMRLCSARSCLRFGEDEFGGYARPILAFARVFSCFGSPLAALMCDDLRVPSVAGTVFVHSRIGTFCRRQVWRGLVRRRSWRPYHLQEILWVSCRTPWQLYAASPLCLVSASPLCLLLDDVVTRASFLCSLRVEKRAWWCIVASMLLHLMLH